jgi:CrcB protein
VRPAAEAAWIAAGGAAGALARWGLGLATGAEAQPWPVTTLAVNLAGAAFLGVLFSLVRAESAFARRLWACLGTGALGAFTTYGALGLQLADMLRQARWAAALAYALASLAGGLVACAGGVKLGAALREDRP